MRIDLHTHSLVSDGTDTPAELVRAAARAELDAIALTDHDTFAGLGEARDAGVAAGVAVLAGVEVSAERGGASVHLLGYGCDPGHAALRDELARIRAGRTDRVPTMVARLVALGVPIALDDVRAQSHGPSLGRPHVADALVAAGHVATRNEAFDRWLYDGGPAYVERYSPDVAAAIALVRDAGGVAVLAHPWGRGRRRDLPPEYLAELAASGLDGVEVDHPDHDEPTRDELRAVAADLGLLATGSSDHHGTGKLHNPLGAYVTVPEVYGEILDRIRARGGRA